MRGNEQKVLTSLYLVEKMTYSIPTKFIGSTDTTSIHKTVVGTEIPTNLVGTGYYDKSSVWQPTTKVIVTLQVYWIS